MTSLDFNIVIGHRPHLLHLPPSRITHFIEISRAVFTLPCCQTRNSFSSLSENSEPHLVLSYPRRFFWLNLSSTHSSLPSGTFPPPPPPSSNLYRNRILRPNGLDNEYHTEPQKLHPAWQAGSRGQCRTHDQCVACTCTTTTSSQPATTALCLE